jgi:hypothetical protein
MGGLRHSASAAATAKPTTTKPVMPARKNRMSVSMELSFFGEESLPPEPVKPRCGSGAGGVKPA